MRIKWDGLPSAVGGVGPLAPGQELEVDEELGKRLVESEFKRGAFVTVAGTKVRTAKTKGEEGKGRG